MCLPVARIGILIDPEAAGDRFKQFVDAPDPALKVSSLVVRFRNHLDPGPQALEDSQVRRGDLRIDHAGES